MKCLLVSDLHYTLKQLDWVYGIADQFDLVVIAGDHLDISSPVAVNAQIVVIGKYFARLKAKTRVVVCSGNHDLSGRNPAGERAALWLQEPRLPGIFTDGGFLEIEDVAITVCPWWDGPAGCEVVGRQLERDAVRRGARWIWVYHAPPDESPVSWAGQKHFGDSELRRWIAEYQPAVVLTGHIHQSPFRQGGSWVDRIGDTWVFNAGRQIGPVPAHVILDMEARHATWFSLAGTDVVHLDGAATRPVP
jgi:Icc-related predicted phosphoesterase